jgi:hypothetical protein
MSQIGEIFFTTVGCMDGRVQEVVAKFGREKFGALYPDTLTEAGMAGLLGKATIDPYLEKSIRFKLVDVSIGKHNSKGVIVHGHAECAGNPVADDQHKDDIRRSVDFIKSLVGSLPVVGVWVHRGGNGWLAEEIPQTQLV